MLRNILPNKRDDLDPARGVVFWLLISVAGWSLLCASWITF